MSEEVKVALMCISPLFVWIGFEMIFMIAGKIKRFRREWKDYKKYRKAKAYWLDYNLSPEEYFEEKYYG